MISVSRSLIPSARLALRQQWAPNLGPPLIAPLASSAGVRRGVELAPPPLLLASSESGASGERSETVTLRPAATAGIHTLGAEQRGFCARESRTAPCPVEPARHLAPAQTAQLQGQEAPREGGGGGGGGGKSEWARLKCLPIVVARRREKFQTCKFIYHLAPADGREGKWRREIPAAAPPRRLAAFRWLAGWPRPRPFRLKNLSHQRERRRWQGSGQRQTKGEQSAQRQTVSLRAASSFAT